MHLDSPLERPPLSSTVVVVIPCYNEARRLNRSRYQEFLAASDSPRLLFVDDGSTDETARVVEQLCSVPGVHASLLCCPRNGGKGEAVRLGMLHALRELQPEFVGFWDADLATPLETIMSFADILQARPGLDMVFGSRVKLLGRSIKRDPRRHYLGRVFATVASIVLRLPIYDTQCGAKLFRVSSGIEQLLIDPFISKWIFDVELIARYHRLYEDHPRKLESVIYEYALDRWEDVAGSKVRPTDFLVAFSDLLKIRSKYSRS